MILTDDITTSYADEAILAADVGNSRIKFFDGEHFASISDRKQTEDGIMDFVCNRSTELVVYSSVNFIAEKILLDTLYRAKIRAVNVEPLLAGETSIDFSGVSGMGIDRKLGLLAAIQDFKPPFITIDFGTCITINIVNEAGKCLGGSILPGLLTQARALVQFTAKLPRINIDFDFAQYGADTATAMNSGIINITMKGLDAHICDLQHTLFPNSKVSVILTGGISEFADKFAFSFGHTIDKNLVIKGIRRIGLKNFKQP